MKFHRLIYSFILIGSLLFARDKNGTTFKNPAGTMTAGMDTVYVDVGNLGAHITNFGVFGLPGAGLSYEWPLGSGAFHLYRGTLAFGTFFKNHAHVSEHNYGDVEWIDNRHPFPIQVISGENARSDLDTYCEFSDESDNNSFPLGIKVIQKTYAYSEPHFDDFIIYDMTFINTTDDDYPDSYIALFFDVDISSNGPGGSYELGFWNDDQVGYDPDLRLSYMYDSENPYNSWPDFGGANGEENGFFGLALLAADINSMGLVDTVGRHIWDWGGPANDWEYYNWYMKGDYNWPPPPFPNDYRFMQSYGPYDLPAADSIHIAFALGLGKGHNELRNNMVRAKEAYSNDYFLPHNIAPLAPRNLRLFNIFPHPKLEWESSGETDVSSYIIYDNNQFLAVVDGSTKTFELPEYPLDGEPHTYSIAALWFNASLSRRSNKVELTSGTPSTVLGIEGRSTDSKVYIHWNQNPETNISGYSIYRNTQLISTITDTFFVDSNVTVNRKYAYNVTALNSNGIESDTSFAISVIPRTTASRILLIDDYGAFSSDRKLFFETFILNGYEYDYWSTFEQGAPDAQSFSDYSSILWFCGRRNDEPSYLKTVANGPQAKLRTYLDNGGNLWLSGSRILNYVGNPEQNDEHIFSRKYLKLGHNGALLISDIYSRTPGIPYMQVNINKYPWAQVPAFWMNSELNPQDYQTRAFCSTGVFTDTRYIDRPLGVLLDSWPYKAAVTGFLLDAFYGEDIHTISQLILKDYFGETYVASDSLPRPTSSQVLRWSSNEISIKWTAVEHSALAGYFVYFAKQPEGPFTRFNSEPVSTDSTIVNGLDEGQRYYFKVSATDHYDQESRFSESCSEIAGRPYAARNFEWESVDTLGVATLTWRKSREIDFDHYNIYVDSTLFRQQTDTSFQINVLETSKFIYITCVDQHGLESYSTDTLRVRYLPANKPLLLVNGILYSHYGPEMENFYQSNACSGAFPADIWDLFPEQGVNYTTWNGNIQTQYLLGGKVPDTLLMRYDKVIWFGNSYGSDEKRFNGDQAREYLLQHGNLILITPSPGDFFKGKWKDYCGVRSFTQTYNVRRGEVYESLDTSLVNLPTSTSSTMGYIEYPRLDFTLPVSKIFQYHGYDEKDRIAGFRLQRSGEGEFIYLAARAYRFNLDSLALNINYMLTNWFKPFTPDSIDPEKTPLPTTFAVKQNYPNPFNPATTVRFSVPVPATVTMKIFDVLGREVYQLKQKYEAGWYEIIWDGHNRNGNQSASGVYFYSLSDGQRTISKKCLLLR